MYEPLLCTKLQLFPNIFSFMAIFFRRKEQFSEKTQLMENNATFQNVFFRNMLSIKKEKRTFASETTERLTQ